MNFNQFTKNKKGFTLLEMLIVMTIVGIILPTVFAIVFVIMRQQLRIYRVVETRRQGDYILSYIKDRLIRSKAITNASFSTSYCINSGDTFTADNQGRSVGFIMQNVTEDKYQIYTPSGTTNLVFEPETGFPTNLNTSNIEIRNFNIDCYRRSTYASPLISIAFDIEFKDSTYTPEEGRVSLHYQTKVKLRE